MNGLGERNFGKSNYIGETLINAGSGSEEIRCSGKRNASLRSYFDCLGTNRIEPWWQSCHDDCVAD